MELHLPNCHPSLGKIISFRCILSFSTEFASFNSFHVSFGVLPNRPSPRFRISLFGFDFSNFSACDFSTAASALGTGAEGLRRALQVVGPRLPRRCRDGAETVPRERREAQRRPPNAQTPPSFSHRAVAQGGFFRFTRTLHAVEASKWFSCESRSAMARMLSSTFRTCDASSAAPSLHYGHGPLNCFLHALITKIVIVSD